MTDTVISSATSEVVIGFNRPFVIIGERINPTGPQPGNRRPHSTRMAIMSRRRAGTPAQDRSSDS